MNQKRNSGGKKFQSRQPGEKRVRTAPKSNTRNSENKFSGNRNTRPGGSKPYGSRPFNKGNEESGGEFRRSRTAPGEKRFSQEDRPRTGFSRNRNQDASPDNRGPRNYGDRKPRDFSPENRERRNYSDRKPRDGSAENRNPRGFAPKKYKDSNPENSDRNYRSRNPREEKPGFGVPIDIGRGSKSYGRKTQGGFTDRKRSEGGNEFSDRGNRKPFKSDVREKARSNEVKVVRSNYKGRGKNYSKAAESLEKGKRLAEGEVRLNRYIANSGMGSRREADVYIQEGLVSINGNVVTELGTKVKPGDVVKVDGRKINPEKPIYILLNKPKGYITTTDDPDGRRTVMELIDLPGAERVYPVGRLDRNTTGVLLLTNDGELAQKLMHPSFEIKKIYKVSLDRKPSKDHMLAWVNGVELEDGFQDFEQCGFVDDTDDTVLGVEIHSGRNRIVRRMFEHFGYEVMALDRVMLGDFDHVKLGRGKWRLLNDKEIAYIERLKRMKPKKR